MDTYLKEEIHYTCLRKICQDLNRSGTRRAHQLAVRFPISTVMSSPSQNVTGNESPFDDSLHVVANGARGQTIGYQA